MCCKHLKKDVYVRQKLLPSLWFTPVTEKWALQTDIILSLTKGVMMQWVRQPPCILASPSPSSVILWGQIWAPDIVRSVLETIWLQKLYVRLCEIKVKVSLKPFLNHYSGGEGRRTSQMPLGREGVPVPARRGSAMLLTSTLTLYLTPYVTLVHQGKGTEYSR